MSYEFVVSIYFVQAMDNVSTLIDLCKYSHPFARVLTHNDESTYIFRCKRLRDSILSILSVSSTFAPLKLNK